MYEDDAFTMGGGLDAMFEEICVGYLRSGPSLYTVLHKFSQPFYHASYAVSVFNALNIFVDALEDQDSAKEEYLEVVAIQYGYGEMVEGELGDTAGAGSVPKRFR